MSNIKSKDYEYLETSREAADRGLRRITRPAFVDKAVRKSKSRITIYLDADIVDHFKKQTKNGSVGYQTLINQALREKIDTPTAIDDPIEKLLKDKKILRRLKSSLKGV
ncbi:MAG: BrnA antitoxin family protein [Pyrinomonadaceae bacterium]|nr:BrnA antitoxin family protein [Pyrinomonadaceae bacterium]